MNIFDKFSLSKEVIWKDGQILMDQQRMSMLPVNVIGLYSLYLKEDKKEAKKFYESMRKGMLKFSIPLGKQFKLTIKDFMDRWSKYAIFGGWGIVTYELIDEERGLGFLKIKDLPMHIYLKNKGIKSASDVIFSSLMAGALTSTFKEDVYSVEVECICSGANECVYYWGPLEYLKTKFPASFYEMFGENV